MKSAGEYVDLLASDLFVGVVEEVGHAANTHSIRARCGQHRERFQVCTAAIQNEAAAMGRVQLELIEHNVVTVSKDCLDVYTLLQHAQRSKSLTYQHTTTSVCGKAEALPLNSTRDGWTREMRSCLMPVRNLDHGLVRRAMTRRLSLTLSHFSILTNETMKRMPTPKHSKRYGVPSNATA